MKLGGSSKDGVSKYLVMAMAVRMMEHVKPLIRKKSQKAKSSISFKMNAYYFWLELLEEIVYYCFRWVGCLAVEVLEVLSKVFGNSKSSRDKKGSGENLEYTLAKVLNTTTMKYSHQILIQGLGFRRLQGVWMQETPNKFIIIKSLLFINWYEILVWHI